MDDSKWTPLYRKNKDAVWIRGKLTNDEEINYDNYSSWKELKSYCENNRLFFKELYLQFKSHQVKLETEGAGGVYLVRSIKGSLGGSDNNRHYYTYGILKASKVMKQMYLTPELIVDKEIEDDVKDCFKEALIYDKTRSK